MHRGFMLLRSRPYNSFRVGNVLVRLQVRPPPAALPSFVEDAAHLEMEHMGDTSSASSIADQAARVMQSRVVSNQATRTITAFSVIIATCVFLWYIQPTSCAAFFFAWQGLFPMQVGLSTLTALPWVPAVHINACPRLHDGNNQQSYGLHVHGWSGLPSPSHCELDCPFMEPHFVDVQVVLAALVVADCMSFMPKNPNYNRDPILQVSSPPSYC